MYIRHFSNEIFVVLLFSYLFTILGFYVYETFASFGNYIYVRCMVSDADCESLKKRL